jgi:hydrogenase maturation protease
MSSGATTDRPTLVIGLGNPILGDDGVGWKVVDELERRVGDGRARAGAVELDRMSVGGLALMERLVGYERAILVDAVLGNDRLGTVWSRPLQAVATRPGSHLDSAHDASLAEAIEAGRALGARLPDEITVVGIAVRRVDEFDERLSAPVAGAVDTAVETVARLLATSPEGAG